MHILFSTIGKQLSTRIEGAAVREKIARGIEKNQWIVLDFGLPTVKAHTTFKNASPFIKAVIANSFKERLHAMYMA